MKKMENETTGKLLYHQRMWNNTYYGLIIMFLCFHFGIFTFVMIWGYINYGDTFAGISGCIGLVVVTYAILTLPKFIKYARCRIFENGITVPTYKKKVIGNKKHKI